MKITASKFVSLLTAEQHGITARGILEHYAHNEAVLRYQSKQNNIKQRVNAQEHEYQSKNMIQWLENENMPNELRTAHILLAESDVSCEFGNHLLKGRIDQLYKIYEKHLLVDTKSHQNATFSDQLQLSFYSYILRCRGYDVLDYAYVRSARQSVNYNQVEIIPHLAMIELLNYALQLM